MQWRADFCLTGGNAIGLIFALFCSFASNGCNKSGKMRLLLDVKSLIHLMSLWLQWAKILHWSLLLLLLKAFQDSQITAWFLPADSWALHCKSKKPANCMGIGLILTPKPGQNRKVKIQAASLQHVFTSPCYIKLQKQILTSTNKQEQFVASHPGKWLTGTGEEEISRNLLLNYCRLREWVWTRNLHRIQSHRQMNKSVFISVLHTEIKELFSPNNVFETINQSRYAGDSSFLCSWVVLPPYNFSPMNRKL